MAILQPSLPFFPVRPRSLSLPSTHKLSTPTSSIPFPFLPHLPPRTATIIRMGGGPRTYPGGVSKWQWKRMQNKKSKQLLSARLARERQIYEMRKRAELKAAVSELEKPWEEVAERAPTLFSVSADEQLKVLADRFLKPGGVDLWSENDGPQLFYGTKGGSKMRRGRDEVDGGGVDGERGRGGEIGKEIRRRLKGIRLNDEGLDSRVSSASSGGFEDLNLMDGDGRFSRNGARVVRDEPSIELRGRRRRSFDSASSVDNEDEDDGCSRSSAVVELRNSRNGRNGNVSCVSGIDGRGVRRNGSLRQDFMSRNLVGCDDDLVSSNSVKDVNLMNRNAKFGRKGDRVARRERSSEGRVGGWRSFGGGGDNGDEHVSSGSSAAMGSRNPSNMRSRGSRNGSVRQNFKSRNLMKSDDGKDTDLGLSSSISSNKNRTGARQFGRRDGRVARTNSSREGEDSNDKTLFQDRSLRRHHSRYVSKSDD